MMWIDTLYDPCNTEYIDNRLRSVLFGRETCTLGAESELEENRRYKNLTNRTAQQNVSVTFITMGCRLLFLRFFVHFYRVNRFHDTSDHTNEGKKSESHSECYRRIRKILRLNSQGDPIFMN